MVRRFGVSLDQKLLARFDELIAREGYANRSEAIRDLIREALVKSEWAEEETEIAGVAALVYDHHQSGLAQKVTDEQHRHHDLVIASLHAHLDQHNCLEAIVLRGPAGAVRQLAASLISTRGVKHGQFVATTTGQTL